MADADFQAKLEAALTWAGIWVAGQKCVGRLIARASDSRICCVKCLFVFPYSQTFCQQDDRVHDTPCPSLTDELVFKLVRSLTKQGITVVFYRDGEVTLSQGVTMCIRHAAGDNDPARAIVLAVAALAEAEQRKQG